MDIEQSLNPVTIKEVWEKSVVPDILPGQSMRDYYNSLTLISRSDLDLLEKGPEVYKLVKNKDWKEPESGSMFFGTAVHAKLLEPELFSQEYYVSDSESPSNITATYVESIKNYLLSDNSAIPSGFQVLQDWDTILENAYAFYKTSVEKTRYEKQETFNEKVAPYKTQIIGWVDNLGKKQLSPFEFEKIEKIEKSVLNHEFAKQLIYPNTYYPTNTALLDVLTEQLITWKPPFHATRLAKSLLDRVIIDHKNKQAILIDLKTTSSNLNNPQDVIDTIKKWNYHRQIAFYWDALISYLDEKKLMYDVDAYIVIVETSAPFRTRVCKLPYIQLYNARKEYEALYTSLEWHLDNDIWMSRDQHEGRDLIYFINE